MRGQKNKQVNSQDKPQTEICYITLTTQQKQEGRLSHVCAAYIGLRPTIICSQKLAQ